THIIQAVLTLLIPFTTNVGQIYAIAAALSVARQFFNPARLALLPEIVGSEDLPRANSLIMLTNNLLLIAGPAAGGVIVGFAGTSPAFFVDAGTFIVAAAILFGMAEGAARTAAPESTPGGFMAQLKEGIAFMVANPLIRYLVPFLALLIFIGSMQSPLIVIFVKSVLLRGDVELGVLMGAMGLGGILGGIAAGIFGKRLARAGNISWLIVLDGALLIAFALNRSYPVGLALFVVFGTIGAALQIIIMSLLQARIPETKRGRVFANLAPVLGPLSIVSIGLGTFLADAVGVVIVLVASGAAECMSGFLAPLVPGYTRKLRELDSAAG
ncbi:MAG: MFS transporter, partial [Chitinivibrionia bacterium]|nr:MFS transporter [Chitinivibrionia bacterium]